MSDGGLTVSLVPGSVPAPPRSESELLLWAQRLTAALDFNNSNMASSQQEVTLKLHSVTKTDVATLEASITSSLKVLTDKDTALASSISTLTSTVSTNNTTLTSSIASEATARSSADSTMASNISTLNSTVGGHTSSITTLNTTTASITGKLSATAMVTLDVDGKVTGTKNYNDGKTGTFSIWADYIDFGGNTTFEDAHNTFYSTASSKRFRFGGPFGASTDLFAWYGPTSVALNSETKTNGYFALTTAGGGDAFYDGTSISTLGGGGSFTATTSGDASGDGGGSYGLVGTNTVTITPSGGTGPYTYNFVALQNPDGIDINPGTGTVSFSYTTSSGHETVSGLWAIYVSDSTGIVAITLVSAFITAGF